MTFAATALYASLLTVLFLALATGVTLHRARTGISILHGTDMTLALWIRRHGNLAENLPLVLMLMALCEARGLPSPWLHAAGIAVLVGRLAHAAGLSVTNARAPLRIIGGALTQLVLLTMSIYLLWSLF